MKLEDENFHKGNSENLKQFLLHSSGNEVTSISRNNVNKVCKVNNTPHSYIKPVKCNKIQ